MPIVSMTATRTGAGKSPSVQWLAKDFVRNGLKVGVIRHPMPYGDLSSQTVQCFASVEDLSRHRSTIEEREEYESHVQNGMKIFAGVDYGRVLHAAEEDAQVILWDGGNNDCSFLVPTLSITVSLKDRRCDGNDGDPADVRFLVDRFDRIEAIHSRHPQVHQDDANRARVG